MMVGLAKCLALLCLLITIYLVPRTRAAAGAVDVASGPRTDPSTTMTNANSSSASAKSHKLVDCGTIASNHTHLVVTNPHHPGPTYVRAICETVIERAHPAVRKLTIKFRSLELYRPNFEGNCVQDRFAVYTDLNVPVTPIMCGNQTGKVVTIPFNPPQSSLVVSITTSDLDHDRSWELEIEQEEWP